MYQVKLPVRSSAEVQEILGQRLPVSEHKIINHIDPLCRAWIERSPFICISSISASGAMDVSPKGDPPGFVKVLDEKTLAIPDRLGNHRGDTFFNVLENPNVGLVLLIPMRREVVRVSGQAEITKDPDLLKQMAVNGKVPDLALIVHVSEAFYHCGKAMIRSGMWEPEKWASIEGLPSYALALKRHARPPLELAAVEQIVINNEANRLY
jgi:uncharacterized protein